MNTHAQLTRDAGTVAVAGRLHGTHGSTVPTPGLPDARPDAVRQEVLQALADRSERVRRFARLHSWAISPTAGQRSQAVVQRVPIGPGGKGYTARKCAKTFASDHLASDEDGARSATLKRPSGDTRWDINTVLMHTEQEVNALVLAADWDATVQINGPVWRVPISANYLEVRVLRGATSTEISDVSDVITRTVWIKVYFDYGKKEVSVTGVHSSG